MPDLSITTLGVLLLTASLVAMLSRRLKLPYSVGLVVAGIALALLPRGIDVPLSRDLVFTVLLPPLIFEAALQLKWRAFSADLPLALLLAFPGVAIAAGVVAVGAHYLIGWGWLGSGLFGVLIAATDPVAVVAAFRELRIAPRLCVLVDSESLLNDGAAAVGFTVLVGIALGGDSSPLAAAATLGWMIGGGVLAGAVVAGLMLLIASRADDHLVEITLTTIAAYGSFLFADRIGGSGVLATLTAGLIAGNLGWQGPVSRDSRAHLRAFWEYAAFLANSVVFLLIGGHVAHESLALFSATAGLGILLVLAGRAAAVYPLSALVRRGSQRIPMPYQHVLFWGGLRGALGLALALGLPATVPERNEIAVVALAVVAFSIFIQGLSMPTLVRRLGLVVDDDTPVPK